MGRMNRQEIIDSIPELDNEDKLEEFSQWMNEVIDNVGGYFREINDLLDIESINDLENIVKAKTVAEGRVSNLY
jgi:predicted sugar kinase